jgi:hypothetical protein
MDGGGREGKRRKGKDERIRRGNVALKAIDQIARILRLFRQLTTSEFLLVGLPTSSHGNQPLYQ